MKAIWTGKRLSSLIHDNWQTFNANYPEVKYNTWKGKRSYWNSKIKKGVIDMPPKPEKEPTNGNNFEDILRLHNVSPELANELTEKGFHVGFIRNAEGEIEYTVPLPHARGNTKKDIEGFEPAQAARITPSKRKPQVRDHKRLYVFSDAQMDYRRLEDGTLDPIHDERALAVGRMICKDMMVDEIINLGDTVDLAALSRFKLDSLHFHQTLGPAFQRVHDYYGELRADTPWAKITEVDSNHNTRLKDFMLKNAPTLYGFRRPGDEDEYPMFTYPYMANLGAVDVDWVSGYGSAEYVYGLEYDTPPIIFKHGNSAVNGGSTAAKESRENPETNVVRGHSHRVETAYRTTRAGNYLASVVVGAACRITGEVPSYHSAVDDNGNVVKFQENWQQGVMVIYDYDGEYQYDTILIRDGKANYNGKLYEA